MVSYDMTIARMQGIAATIITTTLDLQRHWEFRGNLYVFLTIICTGGTKRIASYDDVPVYLGNNNLRHRKFSTISVPKISEKNIASFVVEQI